MLVFFCFSCEVDRVGLGVGVFAGFGMDFDVTEKVIFIGLGIVWMWGTRLFGVLGIEI